MHLVTSEEKKETYATDNATDKHSLVHAVSLEKALLAKSCNEIRYSSQDKNESEL